ncbi:MAG: hypothetical protein AAGF97_06405 [Planctomycetota bacterium]
MTTQQSLGKWLRNASYLVLIAVFATYMIDLIGSSESGRTMVSFPAYMAAIFTGVALRVIGSAVPNMRFRQQE